MRVSTIPSVEGESISLRLLAQQQVTVNRLGLTENIRPVVDELLKLPNGIILITGPTGSGKSTTLYAFLTAIVLGGMRERVPRPHGSTGSP